MIHSQGFYFFPVPPLGPRPGVSLHWKKKVGRALYSWVGGWGVYGWGMVMLSPSLTTGTGEEGRYRAHRREGRVHVDSVVEAKLVRAGDV